MSEQSQSATTDSSGNGLSVDVDGLGVTYGDGTEAVQDVSLAIERGEFFGFLGPNGAGKTTTIKVLATLLSATAGDARVNGYDVTAERNAVRATVGYMAQETSVDEELTARENLEFACDAYGVSRDDRTERITELLELADLGDVSDTPAGNFSGGMKKRLDAATALVHDPELVFLDEPTTGLDPKARNRLWEYFREINDEGTTIFLTTQYLEEADELCDRLAVIRDGSIVERGTPARLKRRVGGQRLEIYVDGEVEPAVAVARDCTAFERDATITATADTVRIRTERATEGGPDLLVALRDAGITVTGFDVEEPTLDDVFLSIADGDTPELQDRAEAQTEPAEPTKVKA